MKERGNQSNTQWLVHTQSFTIPHKINAQPDSEQQLQWKTTSTHLFLFIADHDIIWNMPLTNLDQLSKLCPISNSWPPPTLLLVGTKWQRRPYCCISTNPQQPEHWCIINYILATDPNHRTVWAIIKIINSFLADLVQVNSVLSAQPKGKYT